MTGAGASGCIFAFRGFFSVCTGAEGAGTVAAVFEGSTLGSAGISVFARALRGFFTGSVGSADFASVLSGEDLAHRVFFTGVSSTGAVTGSDFALREDGFFAGAVSAAGDAFARVFLTDGVTSWLLVGFAWRDAAFDSAAGALAGDTVRFAGSALPAARAAFAVAGVFFAALSALDFEVVE